MGVARLLDAPAHFISRSCHGRSESVLGYSREHYISRCIAEACVQIWKATVALPPSPISRHGSRFRCRSQARNRKTLRQVYSRRDAECWLDEPGLGAIDRHKSGVSQKPPSRTNVYVNPNYKPPSRSNQVPPRPAPYHRPVPIKDTGEKRDVVINGVEFKSSSRSLVRKDREYTLGKCGVLVFLTRAAVPQATQTILPPSGSNNFRRPSRYTTKPRSSRQRTRPGRNLTLTTGRTSSVVIRIQNALTTYSPPRYKANQKRIKFSEKQCARFTTAGTTPSSIPIPLCPSEPWYLITFLLSRRQLHQRPHLPLSARP